MSDKSKISWTESTWNPVVGCTKVSPGCDNCYAERMANRLAMMKTRGLANQKMLDKYGSVVNWFAEDTMRARGWNGKTFCDEKALEKPLHWKNPRKIFVSSMGDLFHESVPFEYLNKMFAVMAMCPQQTFQVLTKRPERMREISKKWWSREGWASYKNLWFGITAENQEWWNKRKEVFFSIPAAVHFVSNEPMLSAIRYTDDELRQLSWIIVGGESGPGARPMHPDWARGVRDQCEAAGVPFFFKQWGKHLPESQYESMDENTWRSIDGDGIEPELCGLGNLKTWRVGKKKSGRLLDGREHSEYPKV